MQYTMVHMLCAGLCSPCYNKLEGSVTSLLGYCLQSPKVSKEKDNNIPSY